MGYTITVQVQELYKSLQIYTCPLVFIESVTKNYCWSQQSIVACVLCIFILEHPVCLPLQLTSQFIFSTDRKTTFAIFIFDTINSTYVEEDGFDVILNFVRTPVFHVPIEMGTQIYRTDGMTQCHILIANTNLLIYVISIPVCMKQKSAIVYPHQSEPF